MMFIPNHRIKKPSWRHPFQRIAYVWREWRHARRWKRLRKKGIEMPLIKNTASGIPIDEIFGDESQTFLKTADIPWMKMKEHGLSWPVRRLKHGGGDPEEI